MDEIWVWEAVQHGDSALLNGESLGYLCMYGQCCLSNLVHDNKFVVDWADNGRDILNFLHYFIPAFLTDAPLPTHLRRVDSEETNYRLKHGFRNRTLVGIGHSYGGCTM